MKCNVCKTKLQITHTYSAGDAGKTQSAVCPECGKRYTITSVCEEASQGNGAYARAQAMKKDPLSKGEVEK